MTHFKDKVVLITGAASGIGRELARQLSSLGARIGGIDLQADTLATLPGELAGRPCAVATASVTDRAALNEAVRQIEAQLGPTDVLIAGAGIGRTTRATNAEQAGDADAIISINLIGMANSFYAVLPGMIERKRGQLVALSSLASIFGLPGMGAYAASKSGVNAMCDAFRIELKQHQIAVTVLCPGFIQTPMTDHLNIPKMELSGSVRRMVNAIARRKAYEVWPFLISCQLRFMRWLPRSLSDWWIAGLMRNVKIEKDPPGELSSS